MLGRRGRGFAVLSAAARAAGGGGGFWCPVRARGSRLGAARSKKEDRVAGLPGSLHPVCKQWEPGQQDDDAGALWEGGTVLLLGLLCGWDGVSGLPGFCGSQHERGHSSQRGEPQHPGYEQSGHLALLCPGHWPVACGPSEHPLLQRPCSLDSYQHHPQHEHVHLPAHGERNPLRDTGSGEGPAAHSLGADGLRCAVHSITQVPHHHAHCAVLPNQLLHKI